MTPALDNKQVLHSWRDESFSARIAKLQTELYDAIQDLKPETPEEAEQMRSLAADLRELTVNPERYLSSYDAALVYGRIGKHFSDEELISEIHVELAYTGAGRAAMRAKLIGKDFEDFDQYEDCIWALEGDPQSIPHIEKLLDQIPSKNEQLSLPNELVHDTGACFISLVKTPEGRKRLFEYLRTDRFAGEFKAELVDAFEYYPGEGYCPEATPYLLEILQRGEGRESPAVLRNCIMALPAKTASTELLLEYFFKSEHEGLKGIVAVELTRHPDGQEVLLRNWPDRKHRDTEHYLFALKGCEGAFEIFRDILFDPERTLELKRTALYGLREDPRGGTLLMRALEDENLKQIHESIAFQLRYREDQTEALIELAERNPSYEYLVLYAMDENPRAVDFLRTRVQSNDPKIASRAIESLHGNPAANPEFRAALLSGDERSQLRAVAELRKSLKGRQFLVKLIEEEPTREKQWKLDWSPTRYLNLQQALELLKDEGDEALYKSQLRDVGIGTVVRAFIEEKEGISASQ